MVADPLERFRRVLRQARQATRAAAPAPSSRAAVAAAPSAPAPAPRNDEQLEGPRWRKQCDARDAATGRRCSLLSGHRSGHSASGREFWHVLPDGESAPGRELDGLARSRPTSSIEGS